MAVRNGLPMSDAERFKSSTVVQSLLTSLDQTYNEHGRDQGENTCRVPSYSRSKDPSDERLANCVYRG